MKPWMKAGGVAMLVVASGGLGWMTMRQHEPPHEQAARAPAPGPIVPTMEPVAAETRDADVPSKAGPASDLAALLPDLASDDPARRKAARAALEKVPAERYWEVSTLGAKQTDANVKAQLYARAWEMLDELQIQQTSASTQILIGVLGQQKDGNDRDRTIVALTTRMANSEDGGGSEAAVHALAAVLPDESNENCRVAVCMIADYDLTPGRSKKGLDTGRADQMADLLRERLKNDPSGEARFYAACGLAQLGDNSGVPEIEKDALAMQAAPGGMFGFGDGGSTNTLPWVDALVPALERATGQQFAAKQVDMHDNTMGRSRTERKAKLEAVAGWIEAHPATAPATTQATSQPVTK